MPTSSAGSNRYLDLPAGTPVYDANGNLTYDVAHHYAWDAEGKLVNLDSGTITMTYDALGRQVQQFKGGGASYAIIYNVDGRKLAILQSYTSLSLRLPLPGGASAVYNWSGLSYYRHPDWQGSSRITSTPSRTVYFDGEFAPFGQGYGLYGTLDNADLSFTGFDRDVAGDQWNSPTRQLAVVTGRWTSPDPAGLQAVDPANPQSWNRYSYVLNNPLANVDPLGTNSTPVSIDLTNGCILSVSYYESDTDGETAIYSATCPVGGPLAVTNGGGNGGAAGKQAPINGPAPSTCPATLLNMANQQLGTNFNSSNIAGSYTSGTAYNIIIQSNQLTTAQFNNIQPGAGLAGHIADETNLGFAQSAFQSSNIGGNLSVSFAFHDDHGYANNPIGALIHWITDVLGHNTRRPC